MARVAYDPIKMIQKTHPFRNSRKQWYIPKTIQKSLFKRPTQSIILERELVRYEMSGYCTFSASHNAVSSRFQDNDDIKNDKKKEQKIQQATIKKVKKHEWYPIKRTKRSQQDILYYYLLLSTIHTYLIFVNRGAPPCKSTPKIAKIGRHRPKFCVFCAKKRALTIAIVHDICF